MRNLYLRPSCTALVITCSDFRFKSTERSFAESLGLADDYDLIARPGAVRSIVHPRTVGARDTMTEEIRLLWTAHQFGRIVLVNHLSCRAYDDIATPDTELATHTEHLHRAVPLVEAMCSGLKAEAYLLQFDGAELQVRRIDQ